VQKITVSQSPTNSPHSARPSASTFHGGEEARLQLGGLLHAHEHEAINHHAIVSATDKTGKIIYVNDKFCTVSGYSRDELLGRSHALLKSGMHGSQLYRDMWKTISAGGVWHGELCNRTKDGGFYWVESTIVPLLDGDGNPAKYLSIRTDITHIKEVELALRRQRQLQNVLTEATALLLNTPASEMATAFQHILALSGEFLGACRAGLYIQGEAGRALGRCHEWGRSSAANEDKGLMLDELRWWQARMEQGDALLLNDVDTLPEEAVAERKLLRRQGCQSLFALPLRKSPAVFGYLVFIAEREKQSWIFEDISAFSVLADALAGAISRAQAERSLTLHRERLRRSQIHANIGTWDWDVRSGQMFWTERTAPLLGFPEGDVETTYGNFMLAVHPDDRSRVLDAVDNALRNGESYEIEHRVVWPDGTVRWLLKRGAVVRGENSDALHMLGIVQDIDSRKRTELALIERERQLREAQAIAHMGSWEYDVRSFELSCSDETRRIFAFALDQEVGLDGYVGAIHADDRDAVARANRDARSTGHLDVSCRIFTTEKALRHVHVLANVERDNNGRAIRYAGTVQDISDRVEAQRRLHETEQRFSFAVEGAGDGVWEWDVVTQRMTLSSHCETMLGFAAGNIPPEASFMTAGIHPDDLPEVETIVEDLCAGRCNTCAIELRLRCRDGTYKWVLTRGIVVARDDTGFATRMIGINSDISERKRVEQALIAAREEADRANRAKSEFLSSMSHELRTPMNAILGFGQLLETDSQLDEEQRDNVHEILKAGRHLLELINEVLDLAKVESGRIELSVEPLDVKSVVEECLSLVTAIAGKFDVALHRDVTDGLMVRADRTRLKQALLNLLSNAVKYNRPQGSVTLSAARRANNLRLAVTDTGPGIAAERLPELFQPFNRLDAENSEVEGTGIGLTITERLVEMMGGAMGVDSEVGVGSTFWIDLPVAQHMGAESQIHVPAAVEDLSDSARDSRLVLYIEDNPANLKLLSQMIGRRPGVALITAASPETGIELALSRRPDLILLDINMPGLDGYQVLDILRADPALRTTPVAAVTANAMPKDVLRGMAAGFDDYLTKPLELPRLFAVLDRFLASSPTSR